MSFDGQITFIYSRDPEVANRFYQEVVGLPLILEQDGGCRIYRTAPGAYLGVCREREGRESNQAGLVVCFVRDDVDGMYQSLSEAGAEIARAPLHSEAFGVYSFFFKDPDGHLLEVQRFDDPDWNAT